MKLKTDDKGNAVLENGHPVYTTAEGREVPIDVAALTASVAARNNEAKTHRERAEAAESKLAAFAGIEDPAAAIKALDIVGKLDAKKLIEAGEVENVTKQISEKFTKQISEKDNEIGTLNSRLVNLAIGGAFARSPFIAEKLAVPIDMVQAQFGGRFKLEGERVVGYNDAGHKIVSRANPAEPADFDEALEIMVEGYKYKDRILKASQKGGSGSGQGGNGGGGDDKSMPRAKFEKLPPAEKLAAAKRGVQLTD